MRTAILTVLAAALSMGAAGGEITKETQIAKTRAEIARIEHDQQARQSALDGARKRGDEKQVAFRTKTMAAAQEKLEIARLRLDVLTGKISRQSAEAKVKAAEEAVQKAEEAKADAKTLEPLKAALEQAKKDLATIQSFEGEF